MVRFPHFFVSGIPMVQIQTNLLFISVRTHVEISEMTNLMILMHMRMMLTRLFCEHGVPSWRFVFIVMLLFSVMTMHTNLFFAHKDTFWRFFSMEDVLYGCLDDHITYIFLFTLNLSEVWVKCSVKDFNFFINQLGLVSNDDPGRNWAAYNSFILSVLQKRCDQS